MGEVKRAIVVGATSGIGCGLAHAFAEDGYEVGITGRRVELLASLAEELGTRSYVQAFDVRSDNAMDALNSLITEMQSVDVIVVSAGIGVRNAGLAWSVEQDTLDTNVMGFAAMCNVAWHHFVQRGSGQLVGISSILALRGGPIPSYNASKAFASSYLQGLRARAAKDCLDIVVTDIQPGFVETEMAQGQLFWVASTEKAARQILDTVHAKRKHAYITRRWRLVAWALKVMPDWLFHRL